jgi:hypothetical protein
MKVYSCNYKNIGKKTSISFKNSTTVFALNCVTVWLPYLLASLFLDVYVHGKKQETWGKLFFIT